MKTLGFIAILITGALLVIAERDFPAWGDPQSPASQSPVSEHYITQTIVETKVPNMVTAVLADYRGFDTLFETVVIFTGGIAVIGILAGVSGSDGLVHGHRPVAGFAPSERDMIVIQTCRLLIPVMQLFALYVIAHGHHSPGGGFQGGVILGASFILWAIARDLQTAMLWISPRRMIILASTGVLVYAGIGLLCVALQGRFLDYQVLHRVLPATDGIMARSHAMLGVEVGVAFTVSAIMFGIYMFLSSKGRLQGGL